MEHRKDVLFMTDDSEKVDVGFVEKMLRMSYWAEHRPRKVIEESIRNSLCFSVFSGNEQVGFARVVTDKVTFAWIADVVVSPDHQGTGIGKWMMECIMTHPCVAPAAQKLLRTKDAHGLYSQYGFELSECMTKREKNS